MNIISRFIKWNSDRREWNREHERAWCEARKPNESGFSPFLLMFEPAVVKALQDAGYKLTDRKAGGTDEYISWRLADTEWTLWIYSDGADISSEGSSIVRMEGWDALTPQEFINKFISKALAGLKNVNETKA